ncbi:AraC family transcriptional regulator [Myxococcus sp. MISCRS1]|jgi:AraC-like DNA-binding protein|uniref:AraC family transcriptional regulator n=1 Tax=unclassified Myxococcus TaxID=2648731 RepID=UPI001CBD676B|nr:MULTISPECIES: AraC family transcriptional regulator [unclassified Myxococcus]MBZ4397327.1 AraC family transcriptional regulator [Myxococcus sp. AS-1-15]MBZ4410701.1 AraC family transcriptional regulator [Myxococcus sp. XM-1-1-1]MCY1003851.1 AraC family transcriptional regulator [Myxococcus sp. MISCRS1]BDT34564.1 AraC family transcriptional regulator [Myxococcus sp. MH1]
MAELRPPVDALGEALHFLRMSGTFYCRSELTAPWGLDLPATEGSLMFHVVTTGQCWLEVEGVEARLLQPGTFALVPHGAGHRLVHERGGPARRLEELSEELVSERYSILRHGGGGAPTTLICGAVRLDHPAARHLMSLLPGIILVEPSNSPRMDWLQSTLRFMAAEAQELRPGGETVITRLADVLVVQALREWMAQDSQAKSGWLGALQDPDVGRALALIHREPTRPWTVASLASSVAMSRSAFSARFTQRVGEPPMHYLARWRMYVAHSALKDERPGLGELATRMGYQSEAAFSRAFKRFMGVSPGAVRKTGSPTLRA